MKDDEPETGRPEGSAAKHKRRDRLKLALRENLKRRKSQARERADFMPPSPDSGELIGDSDEEGPGK